MKGKEVGAIIALVVLIPTLISMAFWSNSLSKDPNNPENMEKGAEIIADAAVPWWVGIIETFAGWGTFGALLIIGLFFFLKWIGEVK